MASGAAVDDAVARARRLPSLRVGLHLVLVDGHSTRRPEQIPDLVDGDGRLRSDMFTVGSNIFFRSNVRKQLAAEIEAQFAAYEATGLPLDHVNAHHHFHLHPTVGTLMLAIGKHYGMRAMRVPYEERNVLKKVEPAVRHRSGLGDAWCAVLKKRLQRHGLTAPDRVFGLAWSGAMSEARVAGVLRHLPDGITEIYFHPATTANFAGAASGYRYAEELAALTAPVVKSLVRGTGARTGGYSDFAAA
jgi:hopanoid biosynthesis associated protein HpnK